MKVNMLKLPGGNLQPLDDLDSDKMIKFKTGEAYEVDVKLTRNPRFHSKVFAFFNFCFAHWKGNNEFQDEQGQFDVFRKNLTCLAGYYDSYYNIKGELRIEAKSLSYGNMSQEEFEQCYNALIKAALSNLFKGCDQSIENQLMEFF
jgi:hypothetical protein